MNIDNMEWPLSKEKLEYLYFDEDKTTYEIANYFKKTQPGIIYWFKKYNIQTKNSKKTTQQFKEEVNKMLGNKYTVLGEYKLARTKIKMKHNICGYKYEVTPSKFLRGRRCPKCCKYTGKTTEQFKEEVYNLFGNEYKVLGKYKGAHKKIKIRHNKCGGKYLIAPNKITSKGKRCPKCYGNGYSYGEERIRTVLKNLNIEYKKQYSFPSCKFIYPLRFDIKIKNTPIVIEYNGKQHYEPIKYFGGEKRFKKQQKRDNIKKQYCKENDIKLIEIPYWEKDNIEEILTEELEEVL